MNRFIAVILLCAAPALQLFAEEADTAGIVAKINASGHVIVDQPEGLARRLAGEREAVPAETDQTQTAETDAPAQKRTTASSTRTGYRVQVFDDNNPRTARREANARRNQLAVRFPEYHAYVTFNSPYWCVKVGDFRSRGEAEAAMAEIRAAFPALSAYLRIVRDRINLFE